MGRPEDTRPYLRVHVTVITVMKSLFVALAGLFAFLYLLNPTLGVFELLPDNLPLVGNIDDATATMVLLGALRYFGYDLTNLFQRRRALDFGTQAR